MPKPVHRTIALALFFMLALMSSADRAVAAPAGGKYLGLELGYGFLTSGGGTDLNYGIEAAFMPFYPVTLGAFYDYIPRGTVTFNDAAATQSSGSVKFFGLEGMYNFIGVMGLAFGIRAGLLSNNQALIQYGQETDQNNTGFFVGPKLSYDVPLNGPSMTVGGQLYYLLTTTTNAPNVLGAQACLKYWF